MKQVLFLLYILLSQTSVCQWSHKYYVDNFGDETKDDYISYIDNKGTFSNSATKNSLLITKVLISFPNDTTPEIRLDLYEYGSGPSVGKVIGNADYILNIKLSDGTVKKYSLRAGNNSLFLLKRLSNEFIDILKMESKSIKCYLLIDGDYSRQTYNFSVNPIGFTSAYKELNRTALLSPTSRSKHQNLVEEEEELEVFSFVSSMPEFPGGLVKMNEHIYISKQNSPCPEKSGIVVLRFVVDESGSIINIKVTKSIGEVCDKEAIKIVSEMPACIPGSNGDNPANVYYTLSIEF